MTMYTNNAEVYACRTFNIDMSSIYNRVLPYVIPNGRVLDVGCGSGRDSLYFLHRGFTVEGFDISPQMVQIATNRTGIKFNQSDIITHNYGELRYNLVWCSACFILIDPFLYVDIFKRLVDSLTVGGILYMSFKRGENVQYCDGMYHVRSTVDFILNAFKSFLHAEITEHWITNGTSTSPTQWINIIVRRICV